MRDWPYRPDPATLFSAIADLPWSVLLDSGPDAGANIDANIKANIETDSGPGSEPGSNTRYHILSAEPACTLVSTLVSTGHSKPGAANAGSLTTTISDQQGQRQSRQAPLELLQQALEQHCPPPTSAPDTLPFSGGALGWFGYELGAAMEGIAPRPSEPSEMPAMAVGIYLWALVFDHQQQRAWLVGQPPAATLQRLQQPRHTRPATFQRRSTLHSELDPHSYASAFQRIQHYLRDGDCYQVNLTRRLTAQVSGRPWPAYLALRQHSPAPYGAYLSTPFGQVLCNSPEQFVQLQNGHATTRPIKGTRPRHSDPEQDRQLAEQLQHSAKDRAENVMIVDLLRNDLGRVCQPGSVRVEQLWELHSYATVHHLVSTISGQLAAGNTAVDLLRATFPGGSITGAPKHRAMQIIRELEPVPRGIYCGSIGYLDWHGNMDSNIAIRTLIHQQVPGGAQVQFHAGGGIVTDSVMEEEYQETLDKAAAMLWLLGKN